MAQSRTIVSKTRGAEPSTQAARIPEQTAGVGSSAEQLSAAQQVAELEYRLAQSNLESINIRMNSGTSNIHDAADTRMEASEKFIALQNANFEVLRARVALLRASGEMDSWVQQGK